MFMRLKCSKPPVRPMMSPSGPLKDLSAMSSSFCLLMMCSKTSYMGSSGGGCTSANSGWYSRCPSMFTIPTMLWRACAVDRNKLSDASLAASFISPWPCPSHPEQWHCPLQAMHSADCKGSHFSNEIGSPSESSGTSPCFMWSS